MKLSLVVPCYNEQDNIDRFFAEVKKVFNNVISDYEIVFVNDGMSKSTGRYIVAVRDATTRNAICYYHIDVNTGEFKVEN